MKKRQFRKAKDTVPASPQYPTLEQFDQGRRRFLVRLGAVVAGTGVTSVLLSACGDRSVEQIPDAYVPPTTQGVGPVPDGRLDQRTTDAGVDQNVDLISGGMPDAQPAQLDLMPPADEGPGQPDWGPLAGEPRMPDAGLDGQIETPDMEIWGGVARPPDAGKD